MTQTNQTGPVFYVYEHWRPDKDVCFYVGKGHGKRAQRLLRKNNRHHCRVVAKLARLGMCVEVRMVASALTERQALDLEIDRIRFWRDSEVRLVNLTDGGEGQSGFRHTESTKRVIRRLRSAQKIVITEQTKRKISEAQKGRVKGPNPEHSARLKGKSLTPEHKQAISRGGIGRLVSAETRIKIGQALKGRKHTDASRQNMSAAHLKRHREEDA